MLLQDPGFLHQRFELVPYLLLLVLVELALLELLDRELPLEHGVRVEILLGTTLDLGKLHRQLFHFELGLRQLASQQLRPGAVAFDGGLVGVALLPAPLELEGAWRWFEEPGGGPLLTDNRNPIDLLQLASIARGRRAWVEGESE